MQDYTVEKIRRIEYPSEDYPPIYEFTKNNEATPTERGELTYRHRMCFMMPREKPGCAVLGAEFCRIPANNDPRKLFLVQLKFFTDSTEMLRHVQAERTRFEIEDIYSRVTPVEDETIRAFNSGCRTLERLSYSKPPYTDTQGHISTHMAIFRDLARNKRVVFRNGAGFEKLLEGLPTMDPDITDEHFPAEAAALYLLTALYAWPTEEPEPRRERGPYDPFKKLDNIGDYLDKSLAEKQRYFQNRK